jgi:inosine-uridine nucleoside N-ribohydrolase
MQRVYVVGGLIITGGGHEKGNVFTVPSNKYAEFNIFLDPLAAKTVIESNLNITLIPLTPQTKAASFGAVLEALEQTQQTPESMFVHRMFSLLNQLQSKQKLYHHVVTDCYSPCFSVHVILTHSFFKLFYANYQA